MIEPNILQSELYAVRVALITTTLLLYFVVTSNCKGTISQLQSKKLDFKTQGSFRRPLCF